jgi:hypothetical protein
MRKLITKEITLTAGPAGTVTEQINLDSSVKFISGISLNEIDNASDVNYRVGFSVDGNQLIFPVSKNFLIANQSVSPSAKFLGLQIEKTSSAYDISVSYPTLSAAVNFEIVLSVD